MLDSATLSLSLGLDMKGSFRKITENSAKQKVPFYYLNRKKTLLQYTTVITLQDIIYIIIYRILLNTNVTSETNLLNIQVFFINLGFIQNLYFSLLEIV